MHRSLWKLLVSPMLQGSWDRSGSRSQSPKSSGSRALEKCRDRYRPSLEVWTTDSEGNGAHPPVPQESRRVRVRVCRVVVEWGVDDRLSDGYTHVVLARHLLKAD